MIGVVRFAEPTKLVWQPKKGILLPVRLILELLDDAAGVTITHTVRAGFGRLGRMFDPLFRLYFSEAFGRALDEHVKTEFPRLRELLRHSDQAFPFYRCRSL